MAIGSSTRPTKTNIKAVENHRQAKRCDNDNPGVRLIGNRIYCPLNGKTCHQCRQKTLDFAAFCKSPKGNKECPIKFCYKCLKNRYGENAADVVKLDDWKCPKCRGICNCSYCMKKRGQKPTGILVHAAKSNGFGSVSEMLSWGSADGLREDLVSNKALASDKDHALCSPRKPGKENYSQESNTLNLGGDGPPPNASKVSSKKRKFNGHKGPVGVGNNGESFLPEDFSVSDAPCKAKNKNYCVTIKGKKSKVANSAELARSESLSDNYEGHEGINDPESLPVQRDEEVSAEEIAAGDTVKVNKSFVKLQDINNMLPDVPLPRGTLLTTVYAMELPVEVIGDSLQFLEFCTAFCKVLDLRKGEAEAIVRDLLSGRPKRNGRESSLVRIHIKLLSIIMKDSGKVSSNVNSTVGRNSWLRELEAFVSQSASALKLLSRNPLDGGLSDYDELDLAGKFKLLNFLCDEALGTEPFRNSIEEQNQKFLENGKKAKEKLGAAKDKEKQLKQKLLGEVAHAVIAKNGVPLSISEYEAVVAKVKHGIAEARAEMARIADWASKKRQRSDAVRTQPILVDPRGLAFWRLSVSNGEPDVLLQDLTTSGSDEYEDKWFSFDDGEKEAVDKYISSRMLVTAIL